MRRGYQKETILANASLMNVIGDGRCDISGHNAKYLTYSMQDKRTKEAATLNFVQVTEAGNSNQMELVGFKRALNDIKKRLRSSKSLRIRLGLSNQEIYALGTTGKGIPK